ncbi:MAG: glucosidase [Verrucomicrobia bacterium]|nr:glucosidase [Verrucomicrobiota bacterium]
MTEEEKRLDDDRLKKASWHKWGPYLSERQWGTVREDYSADGEAWSYFTHDQARSRAYRWGEDGIAGISDNYQQLCFALALWNGQDPILKERLFGLTGKEGNHGEDVKEYNFYIDNLPSHAYMKTLYKYPQRAYPYEELVKVNGERSRLDPEYELLDTGIFQDNRYFDVFVEYAKASPEDLAIKISIANRGPDPADLHLLPTLWFRNTWSWDKESPKPALSLENPSTIKAQHFDLGTYWLYIEKPTQILFTENETNQEKLFNTPNDSIYVKDSFHDYVIQDRQEAVNFHSGTKAAPHYKLHIGAGQTAVIKLRLASTQNKSPFTDFDTLFSKRIGEADAFYKRVTPFPISDDMRSVQRQAFAGLLWNKQTYHYVVSEWLDGDPSEPPPPENRKKGRNAEWRHLYASDVFSMPDKWEYPWFAAWDLAFHTVTLALIDPEFSKRQLLLLTREWYMRLDGQLPAYEWDFSDVNPPVHAWAALRIYEIEWAKYGKKDRDFLERMFQKLTLNFTWWVNRKDDNGRNIFEGGFLGLDNISAFNRSTGPIPGAILEQADGTGWMAMYCLNLLQIALELAIDDPVYEDMATKYFEHFIAIADAINNIGGQTDGLWNGESGIYNGLLTLPDGKQIRMTADTLVGIVPIYAVAASDPKKGHKFPDYRRRFDWFIKHRPELVERIVDVEKLQIDGKVLLSIASPFKVRKMLEKLLDEQQFLSPFGIRSVSKQLAEHPISLEIGGKKFCLNYEPAESTTPLFGGNSNWRGPIWFPLNFLLIESLQRFHFYLGDDFKVECPAKSGRELTLWEASIELSQRLVNIFLKDKSGRRPVYGGIDKFQSDPNWKNYILFHEYFHGDNGAGLGASNQTGWTGLTAFLIHLLGEHKSSATEERQSGNL